MINIVFRKSQKQPPEPMDWVLQAVVFCRQISKRCSQSICQHMRNYDGFRFRIDEKGTISIVIPLSPHCLVCSLQPLLSEST